MRKIKRIVGLTLPILLFVGVLIGMDRSASEEFYDWDVIGEEMIAKYESLADS